MLLDIVRPASENRKDLNCCQTLAVSNTLRSKRSCVSWWRLVGRTKYVMFSKGVSANGRMQRLLGGFQWTLLERKTGL